MPVIKSNQALPPRPVVMVIYGLPGVCKTSLFNTCKNPLLIDADKGVDRSLFRKDTLPVNTWDDVLAEEAAGTFKNYDTLGIDTAKALLDDYLMTWVVNQDYKLKTNKLGAYGALGDNFKVFINNRRSEKADIVIIAHAKKDEDTKQMVPDVTGQSYQLLLRIADQVGFVTIKNGKRVITFEPSDYTVGKNVAGIPETIIPDKTDVAFKTFGAELVESVRNAISSMSEEQREAMEKSEQYQDQIAKCESPDELTDLLTVVNELPDYLKLPLQKTIVQKAKDMNWRPNKETKMFEVIPADEIPPGSPAATPPAAEAAPPAPAPENEPAYKKQTEKWFKDRVGKKVLAKSPNAYNGEMDITDDSHAYHLFHVSQKTQGYTFADAVKQAAPEAVEA